VNTTLLVVGFVFVAAAVIGGGLKAVGIEVPVVSSISRQVLLGLAGVGAIVISFLLVENDSTLGGTGALPTTVSLPPAHFPPPAVTLKNRHDGETLCVAYVDGGRRWPGAGTWPIYTAPGWCANFPAATYSSCPMLGRVVSAWA
jgi:hypothetical protein